MLAKIGYLFTRELLFVPFVDRLCCNHFGMMFDFVLMIQHRKCLKQCHISDEKPPHRSEILDCLVQLLDDRVDFHLLITTY